MTASDRPRRRIRRTMATVGLAGWIMFFAPDKAIAAAAQLPDEPYDPASYDPTGSPPPALPAPHPLADLIAGMDEGAGPVIVEGLLVDEGGSPLAGHRVDVALEPSDTTMQGIEPGDVHSVVRIGQSTTGPDGSFQVRVPHLDAMADFANPDGSYNVMVAVLDGDMRALHHIDVRLAGGSWGLNEPDVAGEDEAGVVAAGVAALDDPGGVPYLTLTAVATGVGEELGAAVLPQDICNTPYWWFEMSSDPRHLIRDDVRIQRVHTGPNSTVTYDWTNTRETQMDAAGNIGSDGNLIAVGYVRTATFSGGKNFSVPNNVFADLTMEWNFRPFNLWCDDIAGQPFYSGYYEWRPTIASGDDERAPVSGNDFTCNQAFVVRPTSPTWVSRSTSQTRSVGFDLNIGVSLRSRQTNTTSHVVHYIPDAGQRPKLCGNTDSLFTSSQVQEIK